MRRFELKPAYLAAVAGILLLLGLALGASSLRRMSVPTEGGEQVIEAVDDERGDAYQLVYSRLVFAGRLPHVSVDKAEFDFFFHVSSSITVFLQCRLT